MRFFPAVRTWKISRSAMWKSLDEMAVDGAMGNEGVVLWLGQRRDGVASVSHLVRLRGVGVIKKPRLLIIESSLLNAVTDLTIQLGVALLGQIHSHMGNWVDLSSTDRMYGLAVPHYLSVVAPEYGMNADTSIYDCGIHVFEPGTGFRRLGRTETITRIEVTDTETVPMITVGEE